MTDTQARHAYKPGDIASYRGQLVTVRSWPLLENTPHHTSAPGARDGHPILTDTASYAVQRDDEEHLWYVHEEDLLPMPEDADQIAKAIWDATHPRERQGE